MLLIMAVSLFTVVYVFVINESLDPEENPPSVAIAGTTEGKDIVFENRGGKSLSSDSMICFLSVAGQQMQMTIGPYLQDTNGNGLWDVGERLVFNSTAIGVDITNLQVDAAIIDKNSDSLVMSGTLQEGEIYEFPYVITMDAADIESDRATLWMEYSFRGGYTGNLSFAYKEVSGDWNYTTWYTGQSGEGTYGLIVTGLTPESVYLFKPLLEYGNTTIEDDYRSFKTLGVLVGLWHFDSGSGNVAVDSSGRGNHGTLYNGPNWITGVNNTGLRFDGIDDYVKVPYHDSLDITDELTIEAWMKPLENSDGYYGSIQGSVDTSSFGIFNMYDPDMVTVYGDVYAVVCRGDGNDGFLVTVAIANDGTIDYTLLDIFEFYTGDCYEPDIIHIDGNIFAIAFRTSSNGGYVKTLEIYNDGNINTAIIGTHYFDATYKEPHIYHISGTVYAVVYTGPGYDGYVKTIGIQNDGQITGNIDDVNYDKAITGYSEEPNMIHITSDVYAIAYRNPDSDGELRTIKISNLGIITANDHFDGAYVGKFPFDIFDGYEPNITHVAGNIYAIAYGGFKCAGTIRTVEIYNDGSVKQEVIDAFEFDSGISGYGREPSIIHLSGGIYAIAYRGPDNDGWLKTVEIFSNGTINKSIIDSYEFDTSTCYQPRIIRINNDVYAIVYQGTNTDGLLNTVKIANNGTISKPRIDYAEIGIFECQYPNIIHVTSNIYALAFRGFYDDGYLRTIEIRSDGSINDTIIDSFKFQSGEVLDPMLYHINNDIFGIVYSNKISGVWHGFVRTVKIESNGNITGIDTLDFDPTQGIRPDIVHVNGNIYAIAYRGPSNDGYLKTISINNAGIISIAGMDTKIFDSNYIYYPDIINITGDIFAIAYTGYGYDGYLTTVQIDNTGTILSSGIDTLEFDTSFCYYSNIVKVNEDIFAIAYTSSGYDGTVRTIKIDFNGMIVGGVIDSLEFDSYYDYYPNMVHIKDRVFALVYTRYHQRAYAVTFRIGENGELTNQADSNYCFESSVYYLAQCRMIHINGSIFAIAYRNPYYDGLIRTIRIDYTPIVGYIVTRSDAYRLNANSTTVFAKIYGQSGGVKEISAPLSPGFNYVVLTYNKNAGSNQMKLYVNTTLKSQTTFNEPIRTNSNPFYLGLLHEEIDEVALWRTELSSPEMNQHFLQLTS